MADTVLSNFTPGIEAKAIDTSRILKIGIIGTGWIAEAHIESYKQMDDVDIVAAADLIPGKAEAFMKRYGVEGVLTDVFCSDIIRNEMIPHFRNNDYYGGVEAALRVIKPAMAGEFSHEQYLESGEDDALAAVMALVLVLIVFFAFVSIINDKHKDDNNNGNGNGGTFGGGGPIIFLPGMGRRSTGGGFGGGFGGGGFGGFGGFGGGSFGGGGAGGSW